MKKLFVILSTLAILAFASCNQDKRTERTVLDKDTVGAEIEYEVEKKVREKTVDVDTVTESETVTKEKDLEDTTGSGS